MCGEPTAPATAGPCASEQTAPQPATRLVRNRDHRDEEPFAKRTLADLMFVLGVKAGKTRAQSDLMLARLFPSGIIELENWTAWSRVLGYLPVELSGKSLRELMPLGHAAAGEVVAALLDTAAVEPLDVTLRCKDQRRKRLRLHRRFDPHEQAVFLLAEELSAV